MPAFGYAPPAVRARPARPKDFTVEGFSGLYDSKAKASEQPGDAPLLINLMAADTLRPSQVTLRSGLTRMGSPTIRLGAGVNRTPQWVGMGLTIGGVAKNPLVWCGGELWEISNFGTGTSALLLSTAQLAAAAPPIVLDPALGIGAAVFNGQIVFTQAGVRPFMWDGTVGAGLTVLTNAPIHSGLSADPAVYYGKLFFISTATEIQWSEENQPNIGYTASGFNNAWPLTQTGTSHLQQIIGANEGLYFARTDAIGVIRGAVTTTFSTDGVREGVSSDVGIYRGSEHAIAMCYVRGSLFWFDAASRPWAWRPGTGVIPLWKQLPRQYVQENSGDSPDQTLLYLVGEEQFAWPQFRALTYDPTYDRVTYHAVAPFVVGGNHRVSLVFDVENLRPLCWQQWSTANAPTLNGNGQWVQQGSLDIQGDQLGELYVDENGYAFYRSLATPSIGQGLGQYFDHTETEGNDVPVTGTVVGPMHGWSAQATDWQFDELSVVVNSQSTSIVRAAVLTSRQPQLTLSPYQTVTDTGSNVPSERAIRFGLNRSGRWGRVVVQVQAGSTIETDRPGVHGWRLRGYPLGAGPSLP